MSILRPTPPPGRLPIILFASILFCSSAVRAADVFVGTPALNPAPNQQFQIQLFVDVGADELGSYAFEFLYDPSVVHVVSIAGGANSAFNVPPVTDPGTFSSGITPLAAIQGGPNSGFLSVASLTLEAVGANGSQSSLDLAVQALFNGGGTPLPALVFASSVLIVDPIPIPMLGPSALWLLGVVLVAVGWTLRPGRPAGRAI